MKVVFSPVEIVILLIAGGRFNKSAMGLSKRLESNCRLLLLQVEIFAAKGSVTYHVTQNTADHLTVPNPA